MSGYFYNDIGQKFEEEATFNGAIMIVPVKAEPKWGVSLETYETLPPNILISFNYMVPKAQAQLIKEAVEALMESIMGRNVKDDPFEDYELRDRINKARAALKDEL